MQPSLPAADPFAMLIDPESIVRALEGSQRLERLNRRICRPLDRQAPQKPQAGECDKLDAEVERDDSLPTLD
jgi:hypothetical protein